MTVKKKLAGLVLVTVLLTGGSCYAENKENPIIANTEYGYIRLNMPSVEKIDYFGRYFIQCSYSLHFKQYLPYGIPITSDEGNEYIWFEPLTNREIYIGKVKNSPNILSVDIKKLTNIKGGESSRVYSALQQNFPELLAEVRAANKTANEKYGQELDKGLAALASHDLEMTYTHFKRAYDKGCTSLQMLQEMFFDCWYLGDYDKALEWDSKAIELYPSSRTYNSRAWNNYLLGNNEQALADVNMALSLDGNYTAALDTRGCIYYELGQYDKAIADFDKAIQIKGDNGHNYFYRSKCYKALGEQEKATADFTQAKKLWPEASDEKLNFSFEQSKALARRSESRKLRRSRYQQDLKKLNDAIYVTNNASNFSKLDICEQNRVIINVADAIRNNEPEDFYEEVIPQAVRINYENGTYQQQYEQLQAEIEAEQAAAQQQAVLQAQQQAAAIGGEASPPTLAHEEIAAIQTNPAGRHRLSDKLWLEYQPNRIQIKEPSLAAYYENNVIHYGSYKNWRDNLPDDFKGYVHMDLKRNNVTNYGQYIIVINENNDCTCFDYDASNDTFIIYDNKTQKPDYTLHFTLKKHVSQYDPNDSTTSMVAEATNISGKPIYDVEDKAVPWKTIEYGGNNSADFWSNEHSQWLHIYIPNSRIDGYRLFLQYQSLLK
ncbi:tetratricopeptide repeat protein [Anaerovibrio lipolyticus]|uniref:tetratricopeptide repeat protein n=1 Tax=Anaerovibrio lipolyticus TaxID=82374 RepID=UPI00068EB7C7|nr:tetratricopeptide repeat protein [Anaerovibrio lipolyticus]